MLFKHLFRAGAYGLIMFVEFLTLLAFLAAALLLVLMFRPQWIINESNLRTVSTYVLPRLGVTLDFKSFEAQFPASSVYERGIGFAFEDIRLRTETMTFIAPSFGASAGFNLHPDKLGLTLIGPIVVQEGVFALTLAADDPYEEKKPFSWDEELFAKIRAIRWEMISANFKEINIEKDRETLLKGPMDLQLTNDRRLWTLNFESGRLAGSPVLKSKVKILAKLPIDTAETFPLDITLDGSSTISDQGPVTLDGTMRIENLDDVKYRLAGSFGEKGKIVKAKASGYFDKGAFLTQIDGTADGLIPQLPELALRRCRLQGRYNVKGPEIIDSRNRCEIFVRRKRLPEELPFADLSPETLTVRVDAPLKVTLRNNLTYLQAAPVKASIAPISNGVYNLRATVLGSFDGYLSASTDTIKSEIKLDSNLEVPEFQKLVDRLEPSDFAIPAPLHTLSGRVACGTKGKIVNFGQQIDIPLQCTTALRSPVQALAMDVKGAIQTWLDRKPRLKLDVLFKDVAFELPQMRIEDPIPQFAPDARFQDNLVETPTKKISDQSLPIELDLWIKTEKSARLKTHVLKGEPVPIDFDIRVTGDKAKVAGVIDIKNYQVNFLKRKALVDHVTIRLDPAEESPELDGLFVFKETDFKIDLILKGTVDRPFYYLESDPPRSPVQLLSMLMYGGEADALDTEGQRSVEETRAAMVDGALGLLSMYYLASTPIDSVGYNPYTGVFRARVKLAKGLTLAVGSDLGGAHQSVGIRKRLSENWSFETTAETDEETNESKGVALFKWGRRY
jgi:hypothetical protein